ncbi:ABC transporter ATP-binding protein [Bordetella genomosp. 11]|uniref:Peptide ABC transporter substrate-binding protein n=1 Tax=Bordetella genomosp. 11 TaxID=1416808 RepID=A0A261UY64_9BORD|nr:ABC transporter ATP-binding protein [Bordetella genomosp. 11]OZI66836.1 peptide ABC transporter substrate-binding protein [Bordetella genomosp. 11]
MTASTSPAPLLEVRELRRYFGGGRTLWRHAPRIHAVEDVSFHVRTGETLGLVGESGCGKSTTGRMIVGLERPTRGAIRFRGQDLSALTEAQWRGRRRDVQIIFQNPLSALDPRLPIGRQIREPLDLHAIGPVAERDAAVDALMHAVSLPASLRDRFPHQVSGGQAQRVVIARALALKPSLIVCDEPVSALDVSVQATVVTLLEKLQHDHGIAYLFISHDLRVVRRLSHRVAVMYLGQIVEEGLTDDLYEQPLHPYTRALLSAIPDLSATGSREGTRRIVLKGDPPSPARPPGGCRFHTRCPHARDRCSTEMPALRTIEGGHAVRCHFAGQLDI